MTNRLEKKDSSEKSQRDFRISLLRQICDQCVPMILENTKGREIAISDLVPVLNNVMKQIKDSDVTRESLGIENEEKWGEFFDEVLNTVLRKVTDAKKAA
ncbi:MAG: hypothetical protein PHF35_04180 [Candidatus Moranbacteria bacterium]|nr:hypothetical protein [Candidatus Moranbacteria bacterium]